MIRPTRRALRAALALAASSRAGRRAGRDPRRDLRDRRAGRAAHRERRLCRRAPGIGGPLLTVESASAGLVSGAADQQPAGDAPRRGAGGGAGPDRHAAFRRGQSQPVLPARLQPRPRHRHRPVPRRHAAQHAHPCPRPGLRRHQLPDPELVGAVEFHKGPYFVRDGDFASAGSVRIDYLDSTPKNLALTSIGSFGYKRALSIASAPLAEGRLLVAADAQLYDGPWAVPDALRKISTVARYSQGTALDGFSVTGMAYAARWTATNQIPERAVVSGQLDRYGTLNPTDGGDTSRFSLSGRFSATDDTGVTRASAYVIRSQLNLFNDSPIFSTTRSTATSSTSSTSASSAAARRCTSSRATCSGCRWRTRSGSRPARIRSASAVQHDEPAVPLRHPRRPGAGDERGVLLRQPRALDRLAAHQPRLPRGRLLRQRRLGHAGQFGQGAGRGSEPEARPRARAMVRHRTLPELRRRLPFERRARRDRHRRSDEFAVRHHPLALPRALDGLRDRPAQTAPSRAWRRASPCSGSISPPRTCSRATPARRSRAARPAASAWNGRTATR